MVVRIIMETYLFSKRTGLFWRVKDLVEEHREVKSQTQAYGVCGLHFCLAYIECFLVSILRVFYGCCRKKKACLNTQCILDTQTLDECHSFKPLN